MWSALLCYLIIGYVNQFYSINMTAPFNKEPLYDILFNWLPIIPPLISDAFLISLATYFVCRWLFIDKSKIHNFLKMMSWIFVVRLCCFGSTTVPFPMGKCNVRQVTDPIIWNVFPYLSEYHSHSCYDLMFSGHAAHATLIWLFTMVYTNLKYEKILITVMAFLCNFSVIASRIHYTHDVIIGTAISILMFGTFFGARKCPFFFCLENPKIPGEQKI